MMKSLVVLLSIFFVLAYTDKEHKEHSHVHPDDKDGIHDSSFDHEAILGSKDEASEYGDLSPEESKERLRKLIPKMDIDGDKRISKDELTKWVMASFTKMDMNEAKERLAEYDSDNDEFVSWSELQGGVYNYNEEELKALKEDEDDGNKEIIEMIEEDHKKFNQADTDQDGKLSLAEFAAFEHPYNYKHMQDIEVDRMLKEHDKNQDNTVDFTEFTSQSGSDDVENAEYEKEHFTSLDKDHDGVLNRDEVSQWVSPDNSESAKEEAEHLFNHADKGTADNQEADGFLTEDEIIKQHELFVGSQATDYGNYLHKHPDEL